MYPYSTHMHMERIILVIGQLAGDAAALRISPVEPAAKMSCIRGALCMFVSGWAYVR